MEMEENPNQITPKRIKSHTEKTMDEVDCISSLPDCLLIEILSRLPSTKEAIKTSTLSNRYTHLWTLLPTLIFSFHVSESDWNDQRLSDIFSSLNKTFNQCRQSNVPIFKLHISYHTFFQSLVNNWIRYVVKCNVQHLELSLANKYDDNEAEFVLEDFFYVNKCVTRMKLEGCVFNETGVISWSKLTSLWISNGKLDEDFIQNVSSGCPVLESLKLENCYGFRRIDISSTSVKDFVFIGYSDPEDQNDDLADVVEINAPHIKSLMIFGGLLLSKFLLLDMSSLVRAEVNPWKGGDYETTHHEAEEEMFKGFVLSLRHVREVEIGYNCNGALARLKAKGFTIPSNVKYPDWYDDDSSSSED